MSLQVWLPLMGNLENKGIAQTYQFSNSSTTEITVSNDGKIGKCYNFNSTSVNQGIWSADNGFMNKYINNHSWSLCAWVKTSVTTSTTPIIYLTYGVGLIVGAETILLLGTPSKTIRCKSSITINDGNWHHVAGTYDIYTNNINIYVDGINTGTVPYTTGETYASSWTNGLFVGKNPNNSIVTDGYLFRGSINDVRIYDNALSPLEVKELSQGLVLHYPLNKINKNLFTYNGLTEYNQEFQLADYNNTGSFKQFNNSMPSTNLVDTVGSYFTISLDAISPNGTTSLLIYNANSDPRYFYYSTTLTTSLGNEWQHFTYTFQNVDRGDTHSSTIYHPIEVYMPNKTGGKIRNVKIEFGTAETVWTSYADNSMETTVADCSGYNRNGTVISSIIADIDTARYDKSTLFDGITSGFSFVDGGISTVFKNAFTLSFWVKGVGENGARSIYFASNGSGNPFINFEKYSNNKLFIAWGNSTTATTYDAIYSTANILDGNWYYICIVASSLSNLKIYINGDLDTTSTISRYDVPIIDNKLWRIGRDARSGDGTPFHGNMSDFRLYATALSEADVLTLYKTSAKIDNGFNIHTNELIESNSRELMACGTLTNSYSLKDGKCTKINSKGEIEFTIQGSVGSTYIKVNPDNSTYYYDFEVSVGNGNQFYIGFERWGTTKTDYGNGNCMYALSIKPTTDLVKAHYQGIIHLENLVGGSEKVDTISLRVLNGWSGSTSGGNMSATIHSLSLREVKTLQNTSINKNATILTDEIKEFQKAAIQENGMLQAVNFIEY